MVIMNPALVHNQFHTACDRLRLSVAASRPGRVFLHLACIVRGGKVAWHVAGIRRELGLS